MSLFSRWFKRRSPAATAADAPAVMPPAVALPPSGLRRSRGAGGPHVFITPRAVRAIRNHERAHVRLGDSYAVCVQNGPTGQPGFAIFKLPFPTIERAAVRAVNDQIPSFVERGLEHECAITVIDWAPPPANAADPFMDGFAFMWCPTPTNSSASNPGRLRLSFDKLLGLHPRLFAQFPQEDVTEWITIVARHLMFGDTRAAVVAAATPELVVAAYTDELDCVALLRFGAEVGRDLNLRPGARLVTVNTYAQGATVVSDLKPGPRNSGVFSDFTPLIADFVSDDLQRLSQLRGTIGEEEWSRTEVLAQNALGKQAVREGRPLGVVPIGRS